MNNYCLWDYFKLNPWCEVLLGPPTGCKFEVKFFVRAILWLKTISGWVSPCSSPAWRQFPCLLGWECVSFYFWLGLTTLFFLIVGFSVIFSTWGGVKTSLSLLSFNTTKTISKLLWVTNNLRVQKKLFSLTSLFLLAFAYIYIYIIIVW